MPEASTPGKPPDDAGNHKRSARGIPPAAAGSSTDRLIRRHGEQTRSDSDQTLSDTDQASADTDQTSADADQGSSDTDQLAANHDQAASDHDLASGVDPAAHAFSRNIRQRSAREREQTATARLQTGAARDATAATRDLAALARDQAADARDHAMEALDSTHEHEGGLRALTGADILIRAAKQRHLAAQYRAHAGQQRTIAARDRQAAAADREHAASERAQAAADREALAHQLALAETDALTGARSRAAGLTDLDHELQRCRRTGGLLVVAYVDVIGLKALNDSAGHKAGDELLTRAVALVRGHLRPYDLIIRLGGDEFLCAMSNMTLTDARQRLRQVAAQLAASSAASAIRTGFAQLTPDESATELIARADNELVHSRHADPEHVTHREHDGD